MKFTLTHLKGSRAGTSQELDAEMLTVGRDPSNTLAFDPVQDAQVSGFHANLTAQGAQVVLTDLGSSNGTFVNGQPISGPTPLVSGTTVQFGQGGPIVVIQYAAAGAPAAPTGAPVAGKPAPAASAPAAPTPAATAAAATPAAPKPDTAVPDGAKPDATGGGDAGPPRKGGCALKGGFCLVGVVLLSCVVGMLAYALRDRIRQVVPPGVMMYVQKIPIVNKVFKAAKPPPVRIPGALKKIPRGKGSGADDAPPADEPVEEGAAEEPVDRPAGGAPPTEGDGTE